MVVLIIDSISIFRDTAFFTLYEIEKEVYIISNIKKVHSKKGCANLEK